MHYVKVSTPFEDSDLVKETLEEVQFNKIKTESQLLIRRQPTDSLEPIENMNPLQKSNSWLENILQESKKISLHLEHQHDLCT